MDPFTKEVLLAVAIALLIVGVIFAAAVAAVIMVDVVNCNPYVIGTAEAR